MVCYGSKNNGEILFFDGGTTTFDFKSATFSGSTPNFSATGTTTTTSSVTHTASSKIFSLADAIAKTTQFKEYFGSSVFDIDYNSTPPTISGNNKECTFTLKFKKLNSGYALSSEVSRLTTSGLTIKLTLGANASWK